MNNIHCYLIIAYHKASSDIWWLPKVTAKTMNQLNLFLLLETENGHFNDILRMRIYSSCLFYCKFSREHSVLYASHIHYASFDMLGEVWWNDIVSQRRDEEKQAKLANLKVKNQPVLPTELLQKLCHREFWAAVSLVGTMKVIGTLGCKRRRRYTGAKEQNYYSLSSEQFLPASCSLSKRNLCRLAVDIWLLLHSPHLWAYAQEVANAIRFLFQF